MPFPFVGALAARVGLGAVAKKLAGKALRFVTKGKLLGQGGGAAAARRIGGTVLGAATAAPILRAGVDAVRKRGQFPVISDPGEGYEYDRALGQYVPRYGRRYRRMNPMNVRALRRSVRRINSAEKLFRKVFTITKGQVNVRKARRSS